VEALIIPSRAGTRVRPSPHRFSILSLFGGGIFLKGLAMRASGEFPFEKGN